MIKRFLSSVSKCLLIAIGLSVVLFVISWWIGRFSRSEKFLFDTIAYCAAVMAMALIFKSKRVANTTSVMLLVPVVLVSLPVALFFVVSTPTDLLCLLAAPIGVWTARVLLYAGDAKLTGRLVVAGFVLWIAWFGYPMLAHFVNYHTFTGETHEAAPDFVLAGETRRLDNLSLKDKITVLHFWRPGHRDDSKKFRQLSKKISLYAKEPSIAFYMVNTPPCENADQYFTRLGYDFNTACAEPSVLDAFSVGNYPTTVVLYRDSILYRGSVTDMDDTLNRLLHRNTDD